MKKLEVKSPKRNSWKTISCHIRMKYEMYIQFFWRLPSNYCSLSQRWKCIRLHLMELRFFCSMKIITKKKKLHDESTLKWISSHFMCTHNAHSWILIFDERFDFLCSVIFMVLNLFIPKIDSYGKTFAYFYFGKWIKFTANSK